MASSGSFNTNAYEVRYLTFSWSVVSQSVANNQTTISWNLKGAGSSPSTWYMAGNFKVVIDGTTVYSSATRIQLKGGTVVASGNYTLSHNSSGEKSFSASAEAGIYNVAVNCRGSGSWSLPQIPRSATITSAPNFNDEENPTIKYSNPAGNSVSSVAVCISLTGATDDIPYRVVSKTGNSYTFELSQSERETLINSCINAKSRTVKFFIRTIIGGNTYYNHLDRTLTIVNANPTFNVAYEDSNPTTIGITNNNQLIIRNNSTLEIDVSDATAYKNASLSSVSSVLNGVVYNTTINNGSATFNIGILNVSSNITAVVTLTDSRGYTATKNVNIQVLDWELPTAIINLQRENNFYSETNINVNADYSSLDNKNTINIKIRYKKTTDSSWGSYINLQDDVTIQETLDNNFAWDFQVVVQDRLGTTTYNLVLSRGIPIAFFDRLKRSLGVNCFPSDEESLEVDGDNILKRIAGYGQGANQVTGDWNTACGEASGFYMGNGLSNSPSGTTVGGWWWVIHLVHNDKYQRQIAFSFLNNSEIYTRIQNNGSWNSWASINGSTYSTNEVMIGTHTNGKPRYRKTIILNNFAVGDGVSYNHNISNIDQVVKVDGHFRVATGAVMRYPLISHSGKVLNVYVYPTKIEWSGNDSWGADTNRTHTFDIEYTKTTD